MDSPGVQILLGAIALSSVVQAVILVGLAVGGLQLTRRIEHLQVRVEREIQPALETLTRISGNVAEVSDLVVLQARRVETVVDETMERLDEARTQVRRVLRRPRSLLSDVAAVFKGVRRGLAVYQRLGGMRERSQAKSRRYGGDEHLFI